MLRVSELSRPFSLLIVPRYAEVDQQGVVFNPRSMNAAHMLENIGLSPTPWWDVHLSADEMALLSSRPQVAL